MSCEKLPKCPFYNDQMPIDSGVGKLYKNRFCEGNKEACARYLISTKLGPTFVPSNLYPNMVDRARDILAQNGVATENK